MKKIFLFVFIGIMSSFGQQWVQKSSPVSVNLNKLFFIDSSSGWACGDSGVIIYSSDKGNSWTSQLTGLSSEIVSIFFIDSSLGYALSYSLDGTIVLKTTNGGNVWDNFVFPFSPNIMSDVHFLNKDIGFLAGFQGEIFRTSDGGERWEQMNQDTSVYGGYPVQNLVFIDSLLGFGLGGYMDISGVIYKTSDGGLNWKAQGVGPEPIYDLVFIDSNNVIATGGDLEYGASLTRSSDLGETWNYDTLGQYGIGFQIVKRTSNEIYITLDRRNEYLLSTDSGATWKVKPFPNNVSMNAMVFLDSLNGYAVGDSGKILVYDPYFVNVKNEEAIIPEDLSLNVYPNPFNSYITILYKISIPGNPEINIYNTLGEKVYNEFLGEQNIGEHKRMINAVELSSGIYYLTLKVKDKIVSSKIVLLK
ncbi:MAG TPA: YCF48-related protein [Ignavibacteriaceae bacterium]|nr:YCF48-related protein [Ignavibacteriaceae bacterium]